MKAFKKLWVTTIAAPDGIVTSIHISRELAVTALAKYCLSWWHHLRGRGGEAGCLTEDQVIETYFLNLPFEEKWSITSHAVAHSDLRLAEIMHRPSSSKKGA